MSSGGQKKSPVRVDVCVLCALLYYHCGKCGLVVAVASNYHPVPICNNKNTKTSSGKDIFQLDKIFFPINQNNMHWVCAVAFVQEKRIQFYDSMGGRGQSYLDNIFRYLQDEHVDKNKCLLPDADQWQLIPCTADTPRQRNGFDCGVFTCMFCDFLAQDCPLVFGQDHVTQCRQRMALSILNGQASIIGSESQSPAQQ